MNFLLQWVDVIFLPLALLVVHKYQRAITVGFFIGCMIMLRMQVELMVSTAYAHGILPLLQSHVMARGQAVYIVFFLIYTALAVYSPKSENAIFMAWTISLFFSALFVSMIVMLL